MLDFYPFYPSLLGVIGLVNLLHGDGQIVIIHQDWGLLRDVRRVKFGVGGRGSGLGWWLGYFRE